MVAERLAEAAYMEGHQDAKAEPESEKGRAENDAEEDADPALPAWKKELLSRRRSSRFNNPALAPAGPVEQRKAEDTTTEPAWKQHLQTRSKRSRSALTKAIRTENSAADHTLDSVNKVRCVARGGPVGNSWHFSDGPA